MTSDSLLGHLEALVGFDTRNPPRAIDGDADVFRYCSHVVGKGFQQRVDDYGDGHVSWYAVRGRPKVLFNVHLDTVPDADGWETDPLTLVLRDGRAFGLGACDIKGAAAALLELAASGDDDLALLFTSDEEGAGGCCVSNFLSSGEGKRYRQVVVAEPTNGRAVLAHRGFLSVKTRFSGKPGHSSEARALRDNANHQMARWAARALELAAARKRSADDPGACINLGIVDGGSKSNVIASGAFVHWSARLRPGESNDEFLEDVRRCADPGAEVTWEVPFKGEPLPAAGRDDRDAVGFCSAHGLPVGDAVDFWTEASLFSAAGLPALVMGPGDIAQAHAANEWVDVSQLDMILERYANVVRSHG
jgi:acetylornithine deacetylase